MEKKIEKWLADGLIDSSCAKKMLNEIKEDKIKARKNRINITIYTIAVILIALGVITFISANEWILKLLNSNDFLKIILMSGLTLGSFWSGYHFACEKKNFPKLGGALIVLSSLLIGADYALIGQIYHINADTPLIYFLWLISVLPVAYLFKSRAVNIISIILAIFSVIFFYCELALDDSLIWTIFIPILCGIMLYSTGNIPFISDKYNDFSRSYKIVGSLPVFVTFLVLTCSAEHSYHITSLYYILPIVLLICLNIANYFLRKEKNALLKIETAFLCATLCALLLLLVLPSCSKLVVMLFAHISIIVMIVFGFNYGYKFENSSIIAITNWMLTIYLFANYCRWGWRYMDKTLFFLLGGISLLALGLYLENKRKEISRKDG